MRYNERGKHVQVVIDVTMRCHVLDAPKDTAKRSNMIAESDTLTVDAKALVGQLSSGRHMLLLSNVLSEAKSGFELFAGKMLADAVTAVRTGEYEVAEEEQDSKTRTPKPKVARPHDG